MAVDPNKYKVYAERDVDKSQVNWADAAKTITTDLKKIREDRANTRSQIETDTQKTLKELRTLDPVDNQQLGELALRGSDQSASYLMMQNDLLKSGEINPTDYMVGLQNQKDQWSNFDGERETRGGGVKRCGVVDKRTERGLWKPRKCIYFYRPTDRGHERYRAR